MFDNTEKARYTQIVDLDVALPYGARLIHSTDDDMVRVLFERR